MRILKWLLFIVCFINSAKVDSQWCCLDSTLQILDKTTISLRLLINGALNNNLSSPTQGVCGVRIKFEHKFIGDVTMDLISPSGQKVRLIGPVGNSGNSDFSKWLVTFVRCDSTVVPDKGFKKKWDNLQFWGILGKFYSGTYYPQGGCLQDFNLGSVNGTWTLSISDDEKFYEGKIESFCLLFCDPSGINCMDCSPNGGLFSNTDLDFCDGDPGLAGIQQVSFPVFTPDSNYAYKYIISRNDSILEIKDKPELSNYPVGDYLVCGISYLNPDSIKLPHVGQMISKFKNDLVLNQNGFCAELSKNCLMIKIHPVYNGIIQNVLLCKGDSITIGNQIYNQAGIYNISLKSSFGCDSSIFLNLDFIDLKIISGIIDTLDCKKNKISIDLTSSKKTTNTLIQWSTLNGNFSDLTNSLKPLIDKDGDYKVIFSDGNCTDSAEFKVYKKNDIPDLIIIADTISCLKKSVNVIARSSVLNPTYKWSDGSIDLGSDSLIQVSTPGLYSVSVTDQNGCSNFDVIDVESDTVGAQLLLKGGTISCKDSFVSLSFMADLEIIDLIWEGPGQFMSNQIAPMVSKTGNYILTVQAKNGCISSSSIGITSIKYTPDYFVQPDTLKCSNNRMITLIARTNSIVDSITYTGPSGFYSHDLMPVINEAGVYQINLVDTAGCVLDTFVEIKIDTITAKFQISSNVVGCLNDSVQLVLKYTSTDTLNSILWSGPPGFNSKLQNPYTKEAGLYTVIVTSLNGCTIQDTITVLQDDQKPNILLRTDSLNCTVSQVIIDATVSNIIKYQWTGPKNFSSNIEDPIVRDSGIYKLIVTALNGCTAEKSIVVFEDRQSPIDSIVGGVFTCKSDSIQLKLIQNRLLDSIQWTGPSAFKSNLDSIYIKIAGKYRVFAKGKNGCIDSSIIDIGFDTISPKFILVADTISCKKADATIFINTLDTSIFFSWQTPSGDTVHSKNLSVMIPGWYKIWAASQNGCITFDSIEVLDKRTNPKINFIADSIICSDSIAKLIITSTDLNLSYQWTGPGGFKAIDSSIQVINPGWYHYSVTNLFNCSIKDSFLVNAYLQKPTVLFSNPSIDCLNKANPVLTATLVDSLDKFEWILPSGILNKNRSILADSSGVYIFKGENIFGCTINDTLLVTYDTIVPVITFFFLDTLNCSRLRVIPLVETIPAGFFYSWMGPGNFSSKLPNPILTEPGNYTLVITAANFCSLDTVITLVEDTLAPKIQTKGGKINCEFDSVILDVQSMDSLSMVSWLSPTGAIFNQRTPTVLDTGWYIVIVTGRNTCLSLDSAYVNLNNLPPKLNLKAALIPCNPDSAQIEVTSSDTASRYLWNGPNGFADNIRNPFVRDTGFYRILVIGSNQCKANDSIHVDYNRLIPALKATGGLITCKDSAIKLIAILDPSSIHYIWSGPGIKDSTILNPIVSSPGFYNILIIDSLGCIKDTTVEVRLDTLKPLIQIDALDSLICEQKNIRLINSINCANCNYTWSTNNGKIVSNPGKDSVLVNDAGTYTLQLLNNSNGCLQTQDYKLIEINTSLKGLALQIIQPSCFGVHDAQILFDSILGGVPPYLVSFNAKQFENIKNITDEASGSYSLIIKDRYGCLFDTLINIQEPEELMLSLGRDTSIRFGQSYAIFPATNANTGLLQLISWNPAKELDCINCFNVIASPKTSMRYILKIIDEKGCIAEDDIVISIIDKPIIYLPNSFSPNHDQINDYLSLVSGGDDVKIQSFQVFDRWGNLVFSRENFELSDKIDLWDGTFKGQLLNPGVYVYKIEISVLNGKNYIQAGDINLIR